MLNALLSRWTRTRSNASSLSTLGRSTTSYPPARSGGDSLWQSLLRLMPGEADPWGVQTPRAPLAANPLPVVRAEFLACLDGLQGDSVEDLHRSLRRCRTLRDLWHLRTWLYTEVARAHSQHEAEQRLASLNLHFTSSRKRGSTAARRH